MDQINEELVQCYLELNELYMLGIEKGKSKRSPYSDSALVENTVLAMNRFKRIQSNDTTITRLARNVVISIKSPDSSDYFKLGFSEDFSKTIKSIRTTFRLESSIQQTLKQMAKMCSPRTTPLQFSNFVYGMFPRLDQRPVTVLAIRDEAFCPDLNILFLSNLYFGSKECKRVDDEASFMSRLNLYPQDSVAGCEMIQNHQGTQIFARGDTALIAWFFDGQDVTIVPTEWNKNCNLEKGIISLGKYVYLLIYDYFDETVRRKCKTITGWMGISDLFGIKYDSVTWHEINENESGDQRLEKIKASYLETRKVFKEDCHPLMLSRLFHGMMHINSIRGYVDGRSQESVLPKTFKRSLRSPLHDSLQKLTEIISESDDVYLVPNTTSSRYVECYRFQVNMDYVFEWRWDKSGSIPISFGYTKK